MIAILAHQRQAIQARHDQVLQDHGRLDPDGLGNGLVRIGTEMEVDVVFARQSTTHGLTDHGLVVDQQHHGGIFIGFKIVEL
ncbi:hypothetical protein D3C71_1655980 [compost metagenome]